MPAHHFQWCRARHWARRQVPELLQGRTQEQLRFCIRRALAGNQLVLVGVGLIALMGEQNELVLMREGSELVPAEAHRSLAGDAEGSFRSSRPAQASTMLHGIL